MKRLDEYVIQTEGPSRSFNGIRALPGNQVRMSTFVLKIIALAAMLTDHLEGSFPDTFPVAFGWIGRISIPIFMFCVVQGLIHTSNTKRYLFRLYIGSVVMSVGTFILRISFSGAEAQIADNIFATFFLLAVLITLARGRLTESKRVGLWIGFILIQIMSILLVTRLQTISRSYAYLANGLVPNIISSEGAVIFMVPGILMYVFKDSRVKLALMYTSFCVLMFASAGISGFTAQSLLFGNYQWMMIIALPLMLSYNGERGRSLKYFFYAFYPLHIWFLFLIANFVL